MKAVLLSALFISFLSGIKAQDLSGKWYGYALQDTGELCQICQFELDLSGKKNIYGESFTYLDTRVDIRFNITGYVDKTDSIRLSETANMLITSIIPDKWFTCIKQYNLNYQKIGTGEYLLGRGTGKSIDDGSTCIPALFIFSRRQEDINNYLALHRDSLMAIIAPRKNSIPEESFVEFPPSFNNTKVNTISELMVDNADLEIRLRDYLREDNDTVSVYLNRKLISANNRISKKQVSIKFSIRKGVRNELLLFAENLGQIPPNTSEMYIIDGKKSYRINIESDKQKTAAVYLRVKP